jgi:hypothetical protein
VRALFVALFALALTLVALPARAHGMRSAYLEIVEDPSGSGVLVRLRTAVPAPDVAPRMPAGCARGEGRAAARTDSGDVKSATWTCARPLAGERVGVDGLGGAVTDGVVLVTLRDGRSVARAVTPAEPDFVVPAASSGAQTAKGYVRLGLEHIATGADHLIFLVLLVILVRRPRAVLLAETAFTISHTASFSATALGLVRVPAAAAEACIAFSLVLLALDASRAKPEPASAKRTAALAFLFGLVHGLGFAGGLREIGLPDDHAAAALAGFGAGVEMGQLAVVLVALAAVHATARLRFAPRAFSALAWGAGALASFWLVQRLAVCF